MKTNKFIILSFAYFISIMLYSCSDERFDVNTNDSGIETSVKVSLIPAPQENVDETRSIDPGSVDEGSDCNDYVKDVWLIEYTDAGTMIGTPQYHLGSDLDDNPIAINLPDAGKEYMLVAIANTHNPYLLEQLKQRSTIDELKKFTFPFLGENSATGSYETENESGEIQTGKDLMMSGFQIIDSTTEEIEMNLYRNVAKVHIDVINAEDSGIVINSVQVKSVPDKISYADILLGDEAVASGSEYFNLPAEKWSDDRISPFYNDDHEHIGESMSLYYYLPRNSRGTNSSELAKTKNVNAPAFSTYVEIMAETDDNHEPVRYRFFIGKNMINDFNLMTNYSYHIPIKIQKKGNPITDNRVETFDNVTVKSSNSYIINYIDGASSQRMYSIPIDRINYFWQHMDPNNVDGFRIVDPNTEWIAEVIWQDTPENIFYFCDSNGNMNAPTPHLYKGKGLSDFSVRATGNGSGNVLIGVRHKDADKDKDGYMWSWHLWITDYDANAKIEMNENEGWYQVEGGALHRYDTEYWHNNIPAHRGYCIMDRQFGSHREGYGENKNQSNYYQLKGVCYAFGRKDPFPCFIDAWHLNPLYTYNYEQDFNNEALSAADGSDGKGIIKIVMNEKLSIDYTVKHPTHISSIEGVCADKVEWFRYDWDTEYEKSIFDPTPTGWRLPRKAEVPSAADLDSESGGDSNLYIKLRSAETNSNEVRVATFPIAPSYAIFGNPWPWQVQDGGRVCRVMTTDVVSSSDKRVATWKISTTTNGQELLYRNWLSPTRLVRDETLSK